MIPNPAYKGEWVHPEIDNPDYKYDSNLYAFDSNGVLGIEIWQVKAGTIFDDFLVTDSLDEANTAAEKVMKRIEGEKKMKDEEEKKKREEDEKKRKEEEEKKNKDETMKEEEKKVDEEVSQETLSNPETQPVVLDPKKEQKKKKVDL